MARNSKTGYVQFCVDLGAAKASTDLTQHQRLVDLTADLVALFDRHKIVATWGLNSYLSARQTDTILGSRQQHEIAWLGDASWLGPKVPRAEVAEHLRESRRQAEERGAEVSTLLLRDSETIEHLDLLPKYGVSAVRVVPTDQTVRRRPPKAPTGGVWQVATTGAYPATGRFLGRWDGAYRAKRALQRALQSGTTEHIAVVAASLLAAPARSMAQLERLVALASRLQTVRKLRCETILDAGHRWQPVRPGRPQQSVLRRAA